MDRVTFLFLYDTSLTWGGEHQNIQIPQIEGLTNIDLNGDQALYNRFKQKDVTLNKLPVIVISYQGNLKFYPYSKDNMEQIKAKINILLNNV